jgi:hypothetical protein
MHGAKNIVFLIHLHKASCVTFSKYGGGRNHLMTGHKPKKSTESGEEWLDRLKKWNTVMMFSWGKLNCVCVCHMFFISTSREFGSPVDGGSRISVILPVQLVICAQHVTK